MQVRPVLVIGGVVQDIRIELPDGHADRAICLEPDVKTLALSTTSTFGGGAINVATGLARLEDNVHMLASVGKDARSLGVREFAKQAHIKPIFVINRKLPTGLSVVLAAKDSQSLVTHRGANDTLSFQDVEPHLKGMDLVITHLSGKSSEMLLDVMQARDHEAHVVWSPGVTEIEKGMESFREILQTSPVVILNRQEILSWTSLGIEYVGGVRRAARRVMNAGARAVVVTRGARGSVLYERTSAGVMAVKIPATGGPAIDRVGAGDAYTAGFAHEWRKDGDMRLAAWAGSVNAGAAITEHGAVRGSLEAKDLTQRLQRYPLADALRET